MTPQELDFCLLEYLQGGGAIARQLHRAHKMKRDRSALPLKTLLGLLAQLLVLDVGPAAVTTADWAHSQPVAPPVSRTSELIYLLCRRRALSMHVRGGGFSPNATPPLLTPGFDALDDDETEELVVNSPTSGICVLAPASPDYRPGFQERIRREIGRSPSAPAGRAPVYSTGSISVSRARSFGTIAPQSRAQTSLRPDTPGPARRGAVSDAQHVEIEPYTETTAALSLDERMQLLETTLSDRSSDWSHRVRALKDLYTIIKNSVDTFGRETGRGDSRACVLFLKILPGICAQLQDKRSSLVKEVCATINEIAHTLGDSFEPAAAKLVPALLPLTFVTVRVISVAAWESLHVVSERIRPALLLPELEKGLAGAPFPCLTSTTVQILTGLLEQKYKS